MHYFTFILLTFMVATEATGYFLLVPLSFISQIFFIKTVEHLLQAPQTVCVNAFTVIRKLFQLTTLRHALL
jgi:hypothetical protein